MLTLVILLFARQGVCEPVAESGFRMERITTAQGLSSNIVFCFLQDRTGYLWVGSDDGLNRYDGREFKIFRHRSGDSASLAANSRTLGSRSPD